MDFAWIATAVTAIAGAITAIWISRNTEKAAAAREERALRREREKDEAAERKQRREKERESVIRLSALFLEARRTAESWSERGETPPPFDEYFPETWLPTYYVGLTDAELITDVKVREGLQDCLQAVLWCGGLQLLQGWRSAQEIARNSASIGFVIAGSWLRDEPLLPDTAERLASVQRMLQAYDAYWVTQQAGDRILDQTPDPLTSEARRRRKGNEDVPAADGVPS